MSSVENLENLAEMTTAQRIKLMSDWWPKAARAQGWNPADRAQRMQALSAAVRRPLASASELNNTTDIDAVKAHLGMLCDHLPAAIETDHPEIGKARTLRHFIRTNLLPCLALYLQPTPSTPSPGGEGWGEGEPSSAAEAYLSSLITDVTRWNKIDRPGVPATLDDLDARPIIKTRNGVPHESPSLLNQVIMTLSARIQSKRKEAGDSLHDMRTRARLECNCKQCRTPARRVFYMAPVTVLAADTNEPF